MTGQSSQAIDYDQFCGRCRHYEFSLTQGILCGLTHKKPVIEGTCRDFILDPARARTLAQAAERRLKSRLPEEDEEFFAPERKGIQKGVIGGIVMIAIAIVWFVLGYQAGLIFWYPPVLLLIGIYALIKGLVTGNVRGK